MNPLIKDLSGKNFNQLTALRLYGRDKSGNTTYLCRCVKCGSERVYVRNSLIQHKASCGCQRNNHGLSKTIEYKIWNAMIGRCQHPKHKKFKDYGGRGIRVCERWSSSFKAFLEDMGHRPDGLELDRIDNDGNYEPSNCRWSTKSENNNNKRCNRRITWRGETRTTTQWARHLGFKKEIIRKRLAIGWEIERALTTPIQSRYSHPKKD